MKISTCLVPACGLIAFSPAFGQTALDRVTPRSTPADKQPQEPLAPQTPTVVETPPNAAVSEVSTPIPIGAVAIVGLQVLGPADFADIIADYAGTTARPQDLATLADRLAQRARARGFVFATARIPAQHLAMGVLTVTVDEGHIDAIRLIGSSNAAVSRALASLANGAPVTGAALERALMIAGDIDGIRIRRSRVVTEGSRRVLLVDVAEDRFAGFVSASTDGTRPIGREKLYLDATIAQVLAADDSMTFGYATTPFQPRELQFGRVRYEKRVSAGGTELTGAATYSLVRPGSYLKGFDIAGRAWSGSLGLLQPLERSRRASLWLTADVEVNRLAQRRADILVRRDRTTVARLGVYGYTDGLGGRIRASAIVSQGLDLFGQTRAGDPLASRDDADGSFATANISAQWTGAIAPKLTLQLGGDVQLSRQPLLIGEEVSLGGGSFLRGYDWSERSGDEGAMGSAELRYSIDQPLKLARRLQIYGFADAGRVRNLQRGFGGGSLASAGGGVRLDLTRAISGAFEVAQPLSGPRYDTGDRRPRFNLVISTAL